MGSGLLARNHKCLRERVRDFIVFPFRFGYDASEKCGGAEMGHVVTKSDLVQVAAKAGNLSRAAAGEAADSRLDALVGNVATGKRGTRAGVATLLPPERKARRRTSPV